MFSDSSSIIIISTSIGGSFLFCILYACICVKVRKDNAREIRRENTNDISNRVENPCRVEISEDPKNVSEIENKPN
jgi:hypothetical protein